MPFRFYRRFRAGPFRVNLSKGGASYSVGGRGAWLTFGRGRVRETVGLPGTGLSWSQQQRVPGRGGSAWPVLSWLIIAAVILFAAIGALAH